MCLGLAHISRRVNETTYTSHLIYSASGLVWSGRGDEGVPLQGTGKWMRCLYCNPQAEIVAAVCSHPSERGWSASLQPPPSFCWGFLPHRYGWGQHAFLGRSAVGQHAQPVLEMWIFTSASRTGWPCRLFPPSSWDTAEAPTSLSWLWYDVMPMSASLIIPLKHELFFTFPTFTLTQLCPCRSGLYEFSSSGKPSRSGGHQGYSSGSSVTLLPCAANRSLYYSV